LVYSDFVSFHVVFLFFFQAEDGIRDFHVTGVQTCALPISRSSSGAGSGGRVESALPFGRDEDEGARPGHVPDPHSRLGEPPADRSEERRVGKEWRWRRWREHHKNNKEREKTTRVDHERRGQ